MLEVEIKAIVIDSQRVEDQLKKLNPKKKEKVLYYDIYFDSDNSVLQSAGRELRVRKIINGDDVEMCNLDILYLKAKDEKSRRTIRPLSVGEMEYNGHPFVGMNAYCLMRKEKRVFNVDRILEVCVSSTHPHGARPL